MTIYGIHANAQGKPLSELIAIWRSADALGFHWISTSDHFPGSLSRESNEAVVSHTVMAYNTTHATCGVLAYCMSFRHPAVIATAVAAIDHISNGRAAVGLGAGSILEDFAIYGFPAGSVRTRMDILEEGARCTRALLRGSVVDFQGQYFQLSSAVLAPAPVQDRLPIWIGTTGERRGLRIVAKYADGWNASGISVAQYVEKERALRNHCDEVGRDRRAIRTSVNLATGLGDDAAHIPPAMQAHALTGTVTNVTDAVRRYVDAGVDQVNFALSYPWDLKNLTQLARALELQAR
jgi:alkanesulfonate monooxygenase SsuD/methylene tetrahydromethanopterin reductase-like flavin-dependent oxidoreductase (luciferase family)